MQPDRARFARRVSIALLLGLLLVGGLLMLRLGSTSLSPDDVRVLLQQLPLAPLILIVLLALVLVVPVVPAILLQVAAGLAFGPALGLVYVLLADALGASLGFVLARRWGRPVLRRWLTPGHMASVERLARRMGWRGVILLRLLPGPAYPLVSLAAGLSPLPFSTYLLASLAGVLPSLALLVLAGDAATSSPLLGVAIVLALLAGLFVLGRLLPARRVE